MDRLSKAIPWSIRETLVIDLLADAIRVRSQEEDHPRTDDIGLNQPRYAPQIWRYLQAAFVDNLLSSGSVRPTGWSGGRRTMDWDHRAFWGTEPCARADTAVASISRNLQAALTLLSVHQGRPDERPCLRQRHRTQRNRRWRRRRLWNQWTKLIQRNIEKLFVLRFRKDEPQVARANTSTVYSFDVVSNSKWRAQRGSDHGFRHDKRRRRLLSTDGALHKRLPPIFGNRDPKPITRLNP